MLAMYGLLAFGLFRIVTGDVPAAVTPPDPFPAEGTAALSLLLVLRAFASGSVGLTGSEAVANGVPSFRRPETRNAVITLVLMGTIFATIFLGVTYLATRIGIQPDQSEIETVNSMITRAVVGAGTPFYSRPPSSSSSRRIPGSPDSRGSPRCSRTIGSCHGISPMSARDSRSTPGSSCFRCLPS